MDRPWLERRVLAYAHQGGAKEAPSSTLYAIGRAIAIGSTGIELDVHATCDGTLVVCHDPTLEATTDGSGRIADTSLARIRELDNARYFIEGEAAEPGREPSAYVLRGRAPADRLFGVATLAEVLESFPGVVLNLDIKQTAPAVIPYETALAELLASFGRSDDVIVASFDDRSTEAFKLAAPEVGTSAGFVAVAMFTRAVRNGEVPDASITRHVALQVPTEYGGTVIVDERFVEVAHDFGLAVHVWTIDEPDEVERLVRLGVDGVMTDRPSMLVGLLDRLNVAWRPE